MTSALLHLDVHRCGDQITSTSPPVKVICSTASPPRSRRHLFPQTWALDHPDALNSDLRLDDQNRLHPDHCAKPSAVRSGL